MAILTTKPSPNGKFLIPNILASKGHRGNSIHLKNRSPDCESQFIEFQINILEGLCGSVWVCG